MSKGPDYKKQTSTISAKRAFEILKEGGFVVGTYKEVPATKKAYHKEVLAARRQFGDNAAISITGRSVTMVGLHAETQKQVDVDVPLKGMLGHGAAKALASKTGLAFSNS